MHFTSARNWQTNGSFITQHKTLKGTEETVAKHNGKPDI